MKVGYLHLGLPQHGLHRYGKLFSEEAKTRDYLTVIETYVTLGKSQWQNFLILRQAAMKLSEADIIHIQYNKSVWGEERCIFNLLVFLLNCSAPVVATLHDVYWKQIPFNSSKLFFYLKGMYGPNALAIRLLLRKSKAVFVCTEEERLRLKTIPEIKRLTEAKLKIIPHFVESRTLTTTVTAAHQNLGLPVGRIITLLGWIHPKKGHKLLVEAMPMLPFDMQLIFVGQCSPGSEEYLRTLLDLANSLGIQDRLRVTGYLTEDELNQYLTITDIAVCPFMDCSASGSLSTWISAEKAHIVASNLPQIQEYNRLEPEAIQLFNPYTSLALGELILKILENEVEHRQERIERIARLKQKLSIGEVLETHLKYFQNCLC
jgi:glycosyltransferase involved in cell wall biosynthesis